MKIVMWSILGFAMGSWLYAAEAFPKDPLSTCLLGLMLIGIGLSVYAGKKDNML